MGCCHGSCGQGGCCRERGREGGGEGGREGGAGRLKEGAGTDAGGQDPGRKKREHVSRARLITVHRVHVSSLSSGRAREAGSPWREKWSTGRKRRASLHLVSLFSFLVIYASFWMDGPTSFSVLFYENMVPLRIIVEKEG